MCRNTSIQKSDLVDKRNLLAPVLIGGGLVSNVLQKDAPEGFEYTGKRVDKKTNCRGRHPFNKKQRQACDRIRDCANEYGALEAINPAWYEAAVSSCNAQQDFANIDDFLCSQIGGDVLFAAGFDRCGFDPLDTVQGQQQQEKQERADETNQNQFLVAGALGVVFIIIIVLIARK